MGCDIHGVTERRINGKWVAIRFWVDGSESRVRDRNYPRFAALAGVRGDGPPARGVPDDVSDTARYLIDEMGSDCHSHSWLPLNEAARIFMLTNRRVNDTYAREYPLLAFFDIEDEHQPDECRIVFWFDN